MKFNKINFILILNFSTIYTYDPDNFPPNLKKQQRPIVKLNDVKINIIDETPSNEADVGSIRTSMSC